MTTTSIGGLEIQECQDIDECRRQDDSLNGIFSEDVRDVQEVPLCQNGLCVNTIGGFECQCPDQWILKVGGNISYAHQIGGFLKPDV